MNKKDFKDYDDENKIGDLEDALHNYFEDTKLIDWIEINREGRELYGVMFGDGEDSVEINSPIDDLIAAVAAAAGHGAMKAVAAALGVDWKKLEIALEEMGFYFTKDKMPSPIGFETLKNAIDRVPEWLESDGNTPLVTHQTNAPQTCFENN